MSYKKMLIRGEHKFIHETKYSYGRNYNPSFFLKISSLLIFITKNFEIKIFLEFYYDLILTANALFDA